MLSHLPAMDAVSRVFSAPRDALTPKTPTDPQRIMAAIETARSMGYALIDGERETGEISIAAAVLDHAGLPVGAVEATAPRARWKWRKAREKMASAVAETAEAVTARLANLE
jgi:IclR family pca regulon transcriptional regulator